MELEEMKDVLQDKVRLAVSVIGAGNAGGQVINHLFGKYPVFAVNSSRKDLDDRVMNDKINCFIIGDEARGAGKSRDVAKILLKKNGRKLFENNVFTKMIEDSDLVFVTGAMAGGTGSGIAPELLHLLVQMYPKKIFIYVGILPKTSDSYQAQANTLQCYDEIVHLNIPYMLADLDFFRDKPNDYAYGEIAKHIEQSINTLSGEYLNYSASGMIDENDMRVIVSEPGYIAVYTVDQMSQADVDKKPIQDYLIEKIKKSPAAAIARDGAVKQMGMIVNCPEEMAETTKTGDYSSLIEHIGRPYAIFENYSVNNSSLGQFILILSGMSDPDPRLLICKNIVEKEKPKERKVTSVLGDTSQYGMKVADMSKLVSTDSTEETGETKSSILDSFFS